MSIIDRKAALAAAAEVAGHNRGAEAHGGKFRAAALKSTLVAAERFGLSGLDTVTTLTASASSDATLTSTYKPPADDNNTLCQIVHGYGSVWSGDFTGVYLKINGVDTGGATTAMEFLTDAPRLQIGIEQAPGKTVTAVVNGIPVASTAVLPAHPSYLVMDFGGDASLKRVYVALSSQSRWDLISVLPQYTIMPAPRRPRFALVGDSVAVGTGAAPTQLGYGHMLSNLLGANVQLVSWGGTGYLSATAPNYRSRIAADLIPRSQPLEMLIFQCSTNDFPFSHAAQLAEAVATWDEARAAFPNIPIIHIGSIQAIDNSGTLGLQQELAYEAAFTAWAGTQSGPTLFIRTTPLFRAANNAIYADGGGSTSHRTTAGHEYLARFVAAAIRKFIYSL